ncbi:hypothetical protein D9X91_19255 [Falsibacillus albus]|uniref:Uncharacterized protein n=1 Tax=Falsibacillus albus TaxID=2478915 RepID=A0A3L7JQP2_9BACI|nr:hypothetical protein D9X91_19255 [Falsibacillus albus]
MCRGRGKIGDDSFAFFVFKNVLAAIIKNDCFANIVVFNSNILYEKSKKNKIDPDPGVENMNTTRSAPSLYDVYHICHMTGMSA